LGNLALGPDAVLIKKPYRRQDIAAAIARAIGDTSTRAETPLVWRP